jgi:hypothetical protein
LISRYAERASGCATTVYMTVEEYERVKAAGLCLVAPTHVDVERERAVMATENYAVVERVPDVDS